MNNLGKGFKEGHYEDEDDELIESLWQELIKWIKLKILTKK